MTRQSNGVIADAVATGIAEPDRGCRQWLLEGTVSPGTGLTRAAIAKARFLIGRGVSADLLLPSKRVSKFHAELVIAEQTVVVRDCRSTNGTFVNGARVTGETLVGHGDLLRFADVEFRLLHSAATSGEITAVTPRPQEGWLISQLQDVVDNRRFEMHFQPIVASDGRPIGAEALLRCQMPGLESPLDLFSAAERLGLEERLSRLCRSQAASTLGQHAAGLRLFLNTHPHERLDAELIDSLQELRESAPERPMILEIHETAVPDLTTIREFRRALSDLRIGMAYDGFAAGQSRLRELSVVPPDYLKFDRSLLLELEHACRAHRALVQSLLTMATDQGIATVAGGLDEQETVHACRELGFTHFQGYYFGRPAPASELNL